MLLFAERAIFLFYQFHTLILLFAERAIFWLGLYGGEKLRNHLEWGDYVTSLHHSGPNLNNYCLRLKTMYDSLS